MLLNLLIEQPQALGQIIQNTPLWVGGLLAGLLWLGGSQLFDRHVSLVRAMVMPVAMTGLSVYGLASAFGGSGQSAAVLSAWAAVATLTGALALWLQPSPPKGTLYTSGSRRFHVPGSVMPLALILGIFLTKYFVGVELVLQPALARDSGFALQIAVLYGLFNGLFSARSLRLLRMARQNAPMDATPASA